MKECIIIRHARTTTNIRQTDSMDPELTEFGIGQAKRVGKFLAKHVNLDGFQFYTSPFLRCLATSDLMLREINGALGRSYGTRQFVVDSLLREYINHCGRETTIPVYSERFSNMIWGELADQKEIFYKDEYNEEFLNRLHQFKWKMNDKSLIVTHGLTAFTLMHVLVHNANHVPVWDHSMDNCSITYIVNGRIVWQGRNLYHEVDYDPFDKKRAFDAADLLVPKA
jgi:broad specificity phosphatase PhoE